MQSPDRIPVLTYHSHRIEGTSYDTNDHVALAHDLRMIQARQFTIIPLHQLVAWVVTPQAQALPARAIGLSCDDGADTDYYDCDHPVYGPQRSFYNILRDFQTEMGAVAQPLLHMTSFVIASPGARRELDARCLAPLGLHGMTDDWWGAAAHSGLFGIENHSWDHNHPEVSWVCEAGQRSGDFEQIDSYAECRSEIQQAATFIHAKIKPAWPSLLAYPWGQASPYLRETYLPAHQTAHRMRAAFGANAGYVSASSPRWALPRFVCGSGDYGWTTPDELGAILDGATLS